MSTNPANLEIPFPVHLSVNSKLELTSNNWVFIVPFVLAVSLILLRLGGTTPKILHEGNLTVVALIAYLGASTIFITYLLGKESLLLRLGIWTMGFGYIMNFSAWGIRWIEYVEHAKQQPAIGMAWPTYSWVEKIAHTYPLNNLYDIGLGLTTIAVLTSLIITSRKRYEIIGAITMPVASLILILAVFLGNEITTLQPILRSYWRPIHVSLAAISYGVCLVSFGVALLYLLKDGVKIESIGFCVALLGIVTYLTIGDFKILTEGTYGLGVRAMGGNLNLSGGGTLRANLPWIGNFMRIGTVAYFLSAICLAGYIWGRNSRLQELGNKLMTGALILQIGIFGSIYYQMKSISSSVMNYINPSQFSAFGAWLIKNSQQDPAQYAPAQLTQFAHQFLSEQSSKLNVSFSSNPIELATIVTLIAATVFVVLFIFKGNLILQKLPTLSALDDLTYKIVSVCFPMLAMMLITGAVWANESWGTYWSWDPKETWALVTWLAYAAYLHTRIVHGWKGRSSAYFAVVGFIFVIFTYLGVSFLLPGLHSYAGVN